MKIKYLVECNTRYEYLLCLKIFYHRNKIGGIPAILIHQEEELQKYGFPMFFIDEGDNWDWCIDLDCSRCKCECVEYKKVTAEYYFTNGRKQKLERILNG